MTRVVVVGAGNAALCAALAARQSGADVLVLEAAGEKDFGGNSAYTAGAIRVAYGSADDLRPLLRDTPGPELERCDFDSYSPADFEQDIARVTSGRADPALAATLTERSLETLRWMASCRVGFEPAFGTQAFEEAGRWRFWGGLPLRVRGEGKGLVASLRAACSAAGIEIRTGSPATGLRRDARAVTGVEVHGQMLDADGVVLACGGFEADAGMRESHLGPGWSAAKVRGTRFNTGSGIRMAIDAGAAPSGDWSSCHAVAWDAGAPPTGDPAVAHEYSRNSYQFGIVVNAAGERFLDEGADFRNYTYAAYGRELIAQPGGRAWQVFDAQAIPLLRREYFRDDASLAVADSIEELARAMRGIDAVAFCRTVAEFNASIDESVRFDPAAKDGRRAALALPKSNWAQPLRTSPFRAYEVCCGITFTFGGLRIDDNARVLDDSGRAVPGLYAAGELAGGLWWGNYPGGAGLTAGAVFGRLAGLGAATRS